LRRFRRLSLVSRVYVHSHLHFLSFTPFSVSVLDTVFLISYLPTSVFTIREWELINSDVKLLQTRLFEIIRIQRGLLILLLLLERDFRDYAFYIIATRHDDFELTRFSVQQHSLFGDLF
jgi:hypothetical protein